MKRLNRIRLGLACIDNPIWTAGGIYLRNLVYTLATLPPDEQPDVYLAGVWNPTSPLVNDLQQFAFVKVSAPDKACRSWRLSGFLPRLHRWLPRRPERWKRAMADVLYPAGFGVELPGATELYWIPDLQHVRLPHFFSASETMARQNEMARISRQDALLVLSSHAALDDFRATFPKALVRPRVWSFCSCLGPTEEGGINPRVGYGLPEKFLYLPNQFWAHKDHLTVFKALAVLKAKGIVAPVVCTGLEEDYRHPGHFRTLTEFVEAAHLSGQVRFLGLVPRRNQVQIFRHAAAVIQPSLFEGWSTVVEDAKTLGRPLILSDIAPHKEQAEGLGAFFPAGSPEDLARVLESVWPTLAPGPDSQAEETAREATAKRRLALARDFMAIVQEALTLATRQSELAAARS